MGVNVSPVTSTLDHRRSAELDGATLNGRLQACSLAVGEGVTAVLGSSGAGKTSLLNLLVGFEAPDEGEVTQAGKPFWVPANFGLWHRYSVKEHLDAVGASVADQQALLSALGLAGTDQARPHELSQGQQARLSVARALLSKADWLVMDEPLVHVEPARRAMYWQVILQWLQERPLIFSSHEPETVLAVADRVWCLHGGELVYDGDLQALYHEPETKLLASMLGRVNWFEPNEAEIWLGRTHGKPEAIRPERLQISSDDQGRHHVLKSRNCGAVTETLLEDAYARGRRTFVHQSTRQSLTEGMCVLIRTLVLCVVVVVLMSGCGRSDRVPSLEFSNIVTPATA